MTKKKTKLISFFIIAILLLVFCLQNLVMVKIQFLMFEIAISRALLIFLVYLMGMFSGFVVTRLRSAHRR